MTQDEKIIDKVRKLLALSQSSNPNEAALAAAKAQDLLQQYNLELSQVRMDSGVKTPYMDSEHTIGRMVWARSLLTVLCQYNFCQNIHDTRTGISNVVGEKHNIEVTLYLHEHLVSQLTIMANTEYARTEARIHKTTWRDSFYIGAIISIRDRLEEQKRAFEAASNQTRALIVVKDKELKQAFQERYPDIRQSAGKRVYMNSGYHQGVEAGKAVTLNRAISE